MALVSFNIIPLSSDIKPSSLLYVAQFAERWASSLKVVDLIATVVRHISSRLVTPQTVVAVDGKYA